MKKLKINECGINVELWEAHIDYLVTNFTKDEANSARFATTGENVIETKICGDDTGIIFMSKLQGNKIKHYVYEVHERQRLIKRSNETIN